MHKIAKVEKITSIGKFRDYTAKGDVSFKDFTLIYANNGSGKTTLASILRSLINEDESIIRKRLSDNPKIAQSVTLLFKDALDNKNVVTFGNSGWKKTVDNIEIFDTFFVNQNIYSGFDISEGHKKNLHQFVVGAQGVVIKNKIIKNKQDKEDKKAELERFGSSIISKVGFGLTEDKLKDFIRIKTTEGLNIDGKIKTAEATLKNAQSQRLISRSPELPLVDKWAVALDFPKLILDVNTTAKNTQNKALELLFDKHIKVLTENKMVNAEDWLKTGFDYVVSKNDVNDLTGEKLDCPFCKQEITLTIDVLRAYTQIFNEEFNSLINRLNSHFAKTKKINLETKIEGKQNTLTSFKERVQFWKEYISADIPAFMVLKDEKPFLKLFEGLKTALETKIKNPSSSVSTKPISDFQDALNAINRRIDTLNNKIVIYNNAIKTFKSKLKDPLIAQSELNSLQRIKKRLEGPIVLLCGAYVKTFKEIAELEKDYTQLSKDEEAEANKFITTYSTKINYYLKDVFGTSFQIKDMLHGSRKGRGKDAKVEYNLQLNGQSISFDCDDAFSIQDCLSEGDKSTIAFSFFLSKLEIDPKMSEKILVFDDPLSSLDFDRRHTTVGIIQELTKKIIQTIVLSHNETFIWELYKSYDAGKRKALRINQNFIDDSSFIEELDIAYLVEHDYFKNISELDIWLKKPNLRDKEKIIGLIRNILESHIKFKFYRQLKNIASNNQTFGTCIDELEAQPVQFRDTNKAGVVLLLRKLNAISCRVHHGGTLPDPKSYGVDPTNITDVELAKYATIAFKLIDDLL